MSDLLSRVNTQIGRLERYLPMIMEQNKSPDPPLPLPDFIREAWPVVEPGTVYRHGYHIDAIAEHLVAVTDGHIKRLLINMPPRHMKSLTVSVFWPTWQWTKRPQTRWIFASYAAPLATRDSLKCRRLIQSSWYQGKWRNKYQLTTDQNVKTRFENNKTGYRIATSVGGVGTGEGGDIVVVDDPHKVDEVESDQIRNGVLDWWDGEMSTRLNDPATGAFVIVMQRIHEEDLAGHVLQQGGYEHLKLPAEYEPTTMVTGIGWTDPRKEDGDLLWPERFDRPAIEELKKRLGSYRAAGQLQQRPSPAGGGIIKREWWQYYTATPRFDEIVLSWDMSFKKTTDGSYVVGQAWGRAGADKYLLDQVRDRLSFPETLVAVENMAAKWPLAYAKYVEDKANGPAVIDTLTRKISGLIAVPTEVSKEARAHAVAPQIEAGNVFLPEGVPWLQDFIQECSSFPMGSHDDQVDAMTQALLKLEVPMAAGILSSDNSYLTGR